MTQTCLICYNDSEQRYFGFSNCFSLHTFCIWCLLDMEIKDLHCPIDMALNNGIVTQQNNPCNNELLLIDAKFIQTLHCIYKNKEDWDTSESVIKGMIVTIDYQLDICIECFQDIEHKRQFGFAECFNMHRYCKKCAMKCMDTSFCLIDNTYSPNVLVGKNGITTESTQKFLFGALNCMKKRLQNVEVKKLAQLRIEEILEGLMCPLDICVQCLENMKGKTQLGYEKCLTMHRYCAKCAIICMDANVCSFDNIYSKNVLLLQNGVTTRRIQNEFFSTINYLSRKFADKKLVQTVTDEMMLELNYPLNFCIECLENIKDKRQFGYKKCFHIHRYCEKCTIRHSKSPFCNFDNGYSSSVIVEEEGMGRDTLDWDFFNIINHLNERSICLKDKDVITVMRGMLDGLCYPLDVCIGCLEDIKDKTHFGYEKCHDKHRYCLNCMSDCRPSKLCGKDGMFPKIFAKHVGQATVTIDRKFFQLIDYLKLKELSHQELIPKIINEIVVEFTYPLNICIECLRSIEDKIHFGYENCFNRHRYCEHCALESMQTTCCPIDDVCSSNIVVKVDDIQTIMLRKDFIYRSFY